MSEAGGKKNPYGVSSDPMRGRKNPLQSEAPAKPQENLKRKQKKSVEDAFNPEDPIGNAVRDIWKKVRG